MLKLKYNERLLYFPRAVILAVYADFPAGAKWTTYVLVRYVLTLCTWSCLLWSLYFNPTSLRNLCCLALSYLVLSWHRWVCFDLRLQAVRSTLFDARARPRTTAQWNITMAISNGHYIESSQMVMPNNHYIVVKSLFQPSLVAKLMLPCVVVPGVVMDSTSLLRSSLASVPKHTLRCEDKATYDSAMNH